MTCKKQLLADKIKSEIKDKGLNRVEFAKMMEVRPSLVTRWLSGKYDFQTRTLFKIEEVLDIQLFTFEYIQKTQRAKW